MTPLSLATALAAPSTAPSYPVPAKTAPVRQRHHDGHRRLIVVDIENLIGGAVLHPTEAAWARLRLIEAGLFAEGDQVVIGTSHIGLIHVGTGWTNQRYVVGSGPNGADLALLDVLTEDLPTKYDEVVLVSGDGIFTDAVAALCAAGARTHVVAVRARLSHRLRMAANQITLLDTPYRTAAVPAAA